METAGSDDTASRQPDGMQQGTPQLDYNERALSYIHAARSALDATEEQLTNHEYGHAPAYRIAAAISVAVAENHCYQAGEILCEGGGVKVHGGRSSHRLPSDPDAAKHRLLPGTDHG